MRLASRPSWVPADPPPSLRPGWPLSEHRHGASEHRFWDCIPAPQLLLCGAATTGPLWATVFHLTTGKGAFNRRALRRGLLIDRGLGQS